MRERYELRVLGPVRAVGPDGPAQLHGSRQRAVLGMLALHAGTVLSSSRLVDLLWGDDPPRTAIKTLHSHIARIRQALAGAGFGPVLVTSEPGYLLAVDPADVDAHRFDALVRAARADLAGGDADRAAAALREALSLWRSDAFADADPAGWGRLEVDRLHELRLAAMEDRWEAELRLGKHAEAVRELPRLLATHPMRERLVGLHMTALYRCGRHADALAAFQRLRQRLAEEFGADPGPGLAALHTSILRRDPGLDAAAGAAVPAQIPARVGHFTGRDAELKALDRLLDEPGGDRPVVAISGAAGMGKTALALEWTHRIADRFPDGQLFLDLRGHDPALALPAAEALAHLLRGLDVPDASIPAELAERAALYRSLLHARRCVVLADNVGGVQQVLPLVPGTGRSLLVFTSRMTLAALGARHAVHQVPLSPLDHGESTALLARVLGPHRVRRESGPAARLARLCGGMPLALRIAAARLAVDPDRTIAESAAELAGARLDGLAVEGDTRTVRAVLASAYRPLAAEPARMFRLLGLLPGASFSTGLGAAVSDLPAAVGQEVLAELSATHLVTVAGDERFRFHDLVRDFARDRAESDEPPAVRTAAGERLVDWYLTVAAEANRLVDPSRDRVTPALRHPPPEVPFGADRRAALTFLGAERENLTPVVRYARQTGRPVAAWQLTYLLTSFYDSTGHWQDRVELCRQGAAAATEAGDPVAEAEMLRALGVAYFMTRRLRNAVAVGESALHAARAAGDAIGEGHVYNNLANAYSEMRRFDEAIAAHRLAVDRSSAAGNRFGHALSLRNLGHTLIRMGRAADGLESLSRALPMFRELGNARLEAGTLDALGEAELQLGDHRDALAHFGEAVAVSRACGDRWLEWGSTLDSGRAHLELGEVDTALAQFERALGIARELRNRHGEACALSHLGRTHLAAGDLDAARAHFDLAMAVRVTVPDAYEQAHLHRDLGDLEARCGRPAAAAGHWDRAVALYRQANATTEADRLTTRAR